MTFLILMLFWASMQFPQLYHSSTTTSSSYGIVLRFTDKGLTYALNKAVYKEVPKKWNFTNYTNISIPRVNETVDGINYWIERLILDIKPSNDSFNSFSVTTDPNSECLKVEVLDLFASMRGNVQCRIIERNEKQNCSVILKIPWYFKVNIRRDKNGYIRSGICNSSDKCRIPSSEPTLYFTNCTEAGEEICTKEKSKFVNQFINHRLNVTLEAVKLCRFLEGFIKKDLNRLLKKIDLIPNIRKVFSIDLLMPREPSYTKSYIDSFHKGEVSWYTTGEKYRTNSIHDQNISTINSKMIYLWASSDIMRAFLKGFQVHGKLHYKITAEDVHLHNTSGLNTTCQTGVCVGRLVPSLAEQYPNRYIDLDLYSLATPSVTFHNNLAVIKGNIVMFVYVRDPAQKNYEKAIGIAKLNGKFDMQLKLWINSSTLHAEVDAIDSYLDTIDSSISGFTIQTVNFIIRSAVIVTVEPVLNKLGRDGFTLPVARVHFHNSTVELMNDKIFIGTDLQHD